MLRSDAITMRTVVSTQIPLQLYALSRFYIHNSLMNSSVFVDPSGRRSRWVSRLGIGLGIGAAIVSTLFVLSLMTLPFLPTVGDNLHGARHHWKWSFLPSREVHLQRFLLHRSRLALWNEIAAENQRSNRALPQAKTPSLSRYSRVSLRDASLPSVTTSTRLVSGAPKPPIVAAFYATWQRTGLSSLQANASKLTHLMPEWLHLNSDARSLNTADWNLALTPRNAEVVRLARENQLQIEPILNNAHDGIFDAQRAHLLLSSASNQSVLANSIRDWLRAQKFAGLNLDMENMSAADAARFPQFVKTLRAVLTPAGLGLSVDAEVGNTTTDWKQVAANCDFLVLMAYNEHATSSAPGPIASAKWTLDQVQKLETQVPASKIVVGVGNYSYDWTRDAGAAQTLSYQAALVKARTYRAGEDLRHVLDFDRDALETTFEYSDEAGRSHEVWTLDALSAWNQWHLAQHEGVRGAALWVMGSEDPGVWSFFSKTKITNQSAPVATLSHISFPYAVEFVGNGEILTVRSTPQAGSRDVTLDRQTGLFTDMQLRRYPSSFVIERRGYTPHTLALTFDDGPSPGNTDDILDALQENHVPATFFLIGDNAERNADLVKRIWREGHEIGSHTFTHPNLGQVGAERERFELNATQRAIQSILGRSTMLFRPPYSADAEPSSAAEVRPIVEASQMGYLTVGELIDPQDWNLWKKSSNGSKVARSAQDLEHDIVAQVHAAKSANVVLLHDGGGDRSSTAAALRVVVPQLKAEGYRFVLASSLLHLPRDKVMPLVTSREAMLVGFDGTVFNASFCFASFLRMAFLAAIVLGFARVFVVVPLALRAFRRENTTSSTRIATTLKDLPSVSVLVAAYNEEKVIARTIHSILKSDYAKLMEIVVIDDGSRDETSAVVACEFGNDSRVRLLKQANGGKASALNRGIEYSSGEVLVCFDADTQIAPDAISRLAAHFGDAKVGAVAGNVKVGNRINMLTRWQAIEYIASQNLDRRAYGSLNAITVVPGAIGAWRRDALVQAGGYASDTLAEDMDLTWRIRRDGWQLETENAACAYTEAPDTLGGFLNQRFRWAFGTLQCLWKHRGAVGRFGWFGMFALPCLWVFQMVFQVLAPLIDLQILYSLLDYTSTWLHSVVLRQDWQPLDQAKHDLSLMLFFYAVFFAVELVGAWVAFSLEREDKKLLWWIFWQRFVYRQMMYAVVWKSVVRALHGRPQGWGRLQRKGTVQAPPIEKTVVA